jgi:hypothetical protein
MLLTTRYCTYTHSSSRKPRLEFNLQTAILSVNRQISEEATRILHHANEFVIFKATGIKLHLDLVPTLKLIPENETTNPLLRIELTVAGSSVDEADDQRYVVTTLEGLQPIISAIWDLEYVSPRPVTLLRTRLHHGDLRLTLGFNIQALARYECLSKLALKPWDQVNGLKKLVLTGSIKKPMREHLEKHILEGPFPSEVAALLVEYHSLVDRNLDQKDFVAAEWWWTIIDDYWTFLLNLHPCRLGGRKMCYKGSDLWHVLRELVPMYFEGKMNLIIACFRLSKYEDGAGYAASALYAVNPTCGWAAHFGYKLDPLMHAKFYMCFRMPGLALGRSAGRDMFKRTLEYLTGAPASI